MNEEKKNLGTGLGSLLGEMSESRNIKNEGNSLLEIDLADIVPGQFQPRTSFKKEGLSELAESIKEEGVLQPILVKSLASGRFEIVAGERRWRAAKIAGLNKVPAILKELNNDETAKIALIENLQREDLGPLDTARGLKRLKLEFNLSQEEVASSLGISRSAVANFLRLLNLCSEVLNLLEEGKLDMGHARTLIPLTESAQQEISELIVVGELSVRQSEALVKNYQASAGKIKENHKQPANPNITLLEKELSDILGTKVTISHKKSGQGRVAFQYKNLEHLQGVLEKIKK
tara:strand:+ start:2682 stop:3551 length:870 start_codon:yes stop_codon:yes gene_type:complete